MARQGKRELLTFRAPRHPIIGWVVIALSILITSTASAKGPAGIVLYHQGEQEIFLLLADDAEGARGWCAFGGWDNPGETARETAARETEEETRGYFSRDWLGRQIAKQEAVYSYGYSMYFVKVPFVPAQRVMNHPIDTQNKVMAERGSYAWIPFAALEAALGKEPLAPGDLAVDPLYLPQGSKTNAFWPVWIRNMSDAMKRGAIPWLGSED